MGPSLVFGSTVHLATAIWLAHQGASRGSFCMMSSTHGRWCGPRATCHCNPQAPPGPTCCLDSALTNSSVVEDIGELCDLLFCVPLGSDIWPQHLVEPLFVGIYLFTWYKPWQSRGTSLLDDVAGYLSSLWYDVFDWAWDTLCKLFFKAWSLDSLSLSMAWEVLLCSWQWRISHCKAAGWSWWLLNSGCRGWRLLFGGERQG